MIVVCKQSMVDCRDDAAPGTKVTARIPAGHCFCLLQGRDTRFKVVLRSPIAVKAAFRRLPSWCTGSATSAPDGSYRPGWSQAWSQLAQVPACTSTFLTLPSGASAAPTAEVKAGFFHTGLPCAGAAKVPRLRLAPQAAAGRERPPSYRSWVGEETRPEASSPTLLRSPTGLTWPAHSGWKRALV